MAIFRQIYLENELELHKKYLLESGDFYETGVKLRAMRGFLSAQALQFVTFQETSTNFTMIVTDLLNQYRGYDHAEGVRYLEYLKTELETVLVPLEEAEVRLARLEEAYRKIAEGPETRSRLYTASKSYRLSKLSHEITSLKNRIGFLKNRRDEISKNASSISSENQERLDMARLNFWFLVTGRSMRKQKKSWPLCLLNQFMKVLKRNGFRRQQLSLALCRQNTKSLKE